ncbi:DNA-directed RNA polymerase III subunit RPC6-like [Gigantopelta aegis]|uniref:DNA-directed RNA polymerase III subunit RPC6-like n=1 Tax=Gigantopelta aegis TaxID=1735272 RepID=UPI001B888AB3|nr:DNA-directed RNA polymerase III subunit RPC6-like [Gigantopelta aegis]
MATIVKQEPLEEVDLETRIMGLCQQNPDGVSDETIQSEMPQCDVKQRVMAINRLLSTGRIDLLRSGNKLVYRLKDPDAAKEVKGADHQEKVVYQIIKEATNKGIWIRDIRYKSNLLMTQLNKILKNLESKKLIKAVKSVAASKKKVYMLYNLEPDRTVTGGSWYSDQDFESEFVEVLNQQTYKFLEQKHVAACETQLDPISQKNSAFAPSKDVWKFISELGISKVQLSVEDIETILDTLIFDGKVERSIVAGAGGSGDSGQLKLYRAVKPLISPTGLVRMPCGTCPVFHQCHEGGVISPSSCVYMKDWLDC